MPDGFVLGQQPETVEAWCGVARRNRAGAHTLLNGAHPLEAWSAAGFAVECALKAAVMAHLRFNRFPARDERPDLYTHDLMYLARQAGIDFTALVRDPVAPYFQTVLLWRRTEGYNPKSMPMKVATDMVAAAIGPDGVIAWLARRYRLDI